MLGGAGFIGSHLCESLLADGHEVVAVDSMRFCYPDNLQAIMDHSCFTLVQRDVTAPDFQVEGRFDEIYHLAGVVSTADFVRWPVDAFWASVAPLEKLLAYKRDVNPEARILFASSSEVYGSDYPQSEERLGYVSCHGPRSGYDEGKRAGEALMAAWHKAHGVGAAVVRIFNTYGPRMRANGRLVSAMVLGALLDKRIVVHRPGTQTRTLLYVSDCVTGLRAVLHAEPEGAVNIGSEEELPVAQVGRIVAAAVGGEVKVEYQVGNPDDIPRRRPAVSRVSDLVGWSPTVPFEDGLPEVIEYWRTKIGRGYRGEEL